MDQSTPHDGAPGAEPTGAQPADGSAAHAAQARGMRALTASEFSLQDAVGGVRGVVEALLPGLVFVVVYLLTFELTPTLVASAGVAVLMVIVRLVQRTPVTQALSGLFGVAIGVVWAWRTGEASDFFVVGLYTNAAYLLGCLVSIVVRWPAIGVVVELFRLGFAETKTVRAPEGDVDPDAPAPNPFAGFGEWRRSHALVRRYTLATWLWVALFAVRLAVQVPLYLGAQVGWLGTARLAMGIPLWAVTLWGTWILVRRSAGRTEQPRPRPGH